MCQSPTRKHPIADVETGLGGADGAPLSEHLSAPPRSDLVLHDCSILKQAGLRMSISEFLAA
jgi:hypothetical protein